MFARFIYALCVSARVYLFISGGISGCFYFLATREKKSYHQHLCPGCCVDVCVWVSFHFICTDIHLELKLLSHHGNYVHHFKEF